MEDTEDQKRLRVTVADEIQAVMDKHEVGGVVLLCSRESAAVHGVGLQPRPGREDKSPGARLRIHSRTLESRAQADSTMGLIANLREMSADVANLFGHLWRAAKRELERQGAEIEHEPFSGTRGIFPGGRKGG